MQWITLYAVTLVSLFLAVPQACATKTQRANFSPVIKQNQPVTLKLPSPPRHQTQSKSAATPVSAPVRSSAPSEMEEAKSLLVANQAYVLRFEEEEGATLVGSPKENSARVTFSNGEVEKYQHAIGEILRYRGELKSHCSSQSSENLRVALDRYLTGLAAFNRRALPLVADISENNRNLVLVVNRTLLVDAPVLTSRYLQFKRQRFKESLDRFRPADENLVANMIAVATLLRVELPDEVWDRPYALRENALEAISLWPRENIFAAAEKLRDSRETACVVQAEPVTRIAEAPGKTPSSRMAE